MVSCYACSVFGMIISVWAIIQLTVMGFCYDAEAPTLLEDTEPHIYNDFQDFLTKCRENYAILGFNCFFVAYIYIWIFLLCLFSMLKCRVSYKKYEMKFEDDEYHCNRPPKKKYCERKKVVK